MKKVAGGMRLDLAQYRELEAFAQFGSELDKSTQAAIAKGERMVEVLKQDQWVPMPVEDQVMIVWSGIMGYLDTVPVEKVQDFEVRFLSFMRSTHPAVGKSIVSEGKITEENEVALRAALDEFLGTYSA